MEEKKKELCSEVDEKGEKKANSDLEADEKEEKKANSNVAVDEEEKRKAYSEVVEILKLIDNEQILEKIPFEVIELIKNNSDASYKPIINKEIPLEEQNLKNETFGILGWIANKFWDEELVIKREEKQYDENAQNVAAFNDIELEYFRKDLESNKLPILSSDIRWYQKIKMQVIKLFRILFRVKTKEEIE